VQNSKQPSLDLGIIGNCQISALIDQQGRYVWACLPRLDGDPVFCSLLRNDAEEDTQGVFSVELEGASKFQQSYERNTAVLETIIATDDGTSIRIIDFCPRFRQYGRNYRPVMIIRIVEPVLGHPVVRTKLRPLANYGSQRMTHHVGSHHIRYETPTQSMRVSTNVSLTAIIEERPVVLREPMYFVIGDDESVTESLRALATRFLDETRRYWHDWTRELAVPFEWQQAVIRSAITLKLCSFEDTGAVVAALTTSIPESANSGRNWDYRFCWLRDSYFTIHALNRLGATRTMEGYLRYINNVFAASRNAPLQPVYGISGESALVERIVESLAGYRGMGPVRVGNQAYEQIQHDVYGAVILAAMQSFFDERLSTPAGLALFEQLQFAGEQCYQLYDKRDAGIWEYRGHTEVHVFSSALCWAGVDRLARIAQHLHLTDREKFWRNRANEMRARIIDATWSRTHNSFVRGWHAQSLDASVLLLAELGFVQVDDPKFIATVEAIGRDLRRDGYLMRYIDKDDFGTPDNAFNICTFWYINALASIGKTDEARSLFENMLARRNHLGLLSEDIDPQTGELWGNFPQTYSMVGIITAATRLSRRWEDAF